MIMCRYVAPQVIFTVYTCSYIQERFRLCPFTHAMVGNAVVDGAKDSPVGGDNATLMDANHHKTQQKKKKMHHS